MAAELVLRVGVVFAGVSPGVLMEGELHGQLVSRASTC